MALARFLTMRSFGCRQSAAPAGFGPGSLHHGTPSVMSNRSAPPRQVIGLLCLGQLHRPLQRLIEVILHRRSSHPTTQEVGPQELAEGRGVLGKTAQSPQLSREAAKGVIDEVGNGLWQLVR